VTFRRTYLRFCPVKHKAETATEIPTFERQSLAYQSHRGSGYGYSYEQV
jgi:hypothetical protein